MQLSAAKRKYKTLNSTAWATIPSICPWEPADPPLPGDTFNCTLVLETGNNLMALSAVGEALPLWAGPTNPDTGIPWLRI